MANKRRLLTAVIDDIYSRVDSVQLSAESRLTEVENRKLIEAIELLNDLTTHMGTVKLEMMKIIDECSISL